MEIKIIDPGPIPHTEIERFDDPDIETALEQVGIDPAKATYRLLEVPLEELEDTRWFPGPHPWGTRMVDALTVGGAFPPVVVVATERGHGYGLIDGLNRTHAHWALRRPTIRAYELLNVQRDTPWSVTRIGLTGSLARLVAENQPCVVLTGAGASTESGVPDFRSASGMWAEFDPREYATVGAFRRDPEKVWRFYAPRFAMLTSVEPNPAHLALADLERLGLVQAVVTQNIDLLHQRAGSRDVIEVHGSIRTSSCPDCGAVYPLAEVEPLIEAHGAPPCPACGAILKPDVVFFDELLPEGAMERATELAEGAGLLLVIGSSLEVYPVADLPRSTLVAGGKVAVVNRTPTWVDPRAELVLRESAAAVLEATVIALRSPPQPLEIAEYDPGWPRRYEEEAARIRVALGDLVVRIEHMGSTSVPGLAAKPVIDISLGLTTLELDQGHITAMENLGYEYLGEFGLPGRLYFRKDRDRRTHQVHGVEFDGEHWHRHLAFRDYLRALPQEAQSYAEAKRRLATEVDHDWRAYVHRKDEVMDDLFARAWAWYRPG